VLDSVIEFPEDQALTIRSGDGLCHESYKPCDLEGEILVERFNRTLGGTYNGKHCGKKKEILS